MHHKLCFVSRRWLCSHDCFLVMHKAQVKNVSLSYPAVTAILKKLNNTIILSSLCLDFFLCFLYDTLTGSNIFRYHFNSWWKRVLLNVYYLRLSQHNKKASCEEMIGPASECICSFGCRDVSPSMLRLD